MSEGTARSGYAGQQNLNADTSDFNKIAFLVKQVLGKVRTCTIVKVMKVAEEEEGVVIAGFVDVKPIIKMVDGLMQATSHETIFNIPYFRLQGGGNAIVLDPAVGDIGMLLVSDRDSSSVKRTREEGNPGSKRQFDLADGIYAGGIRNEVPDQYVRFHTTGIDVIDKNGNELLFGETGISINGVLFDQEQNVTNVKELTSQSGVELTAHTHAQGNDSHGDTEVDTDPPTATA